MTGTATSSAPFSLVRARAIAVVRARRLVRTRRVVLAAVLALLPWLAVGDVPLLARVGALTQFTVVGLTVLAAGAIAEDLDGGQYAVALTHGCSPIEAMLGETAATLLLALALTGAQLLFVIRHETIVELGLLLICLGWLAALLAGWMAVMLLVATLARGVGNAIAMIPLLTVVPLLATTGALDHLPAPVAAPLRALIQLLPTPQLVSEIHRSTFLGSAPPRSAMIVLLISPVVWFAAAALRLARLEPAARVVA